MLDENIVNRELFQLIGGQMQGIIHGKKQKIRRTKRSYKKKSQKLQLIWVCESVEVSSLIEYKSNSTERVSDLLSAFPSLIKRSTESPITPSQGD